MKKYIFEFIQKINIIAFIHRLIMRKKIKNTDMTFFCPNCIGGILFHDLGLKFRSPTVNLMIRHKDFVKFVLDYKSYLKQKLVFFSHPHYQCPCAKLGDITIHFTHYRTEKEAEEKWKERCKRINENNLFIFAMEKDNLTKKEIELLRNINARGIVVFTAHEYPDIPYTLCIKKYDSQGEVGNILKKSYLKDSKEYEKYFDFISWFNEANGKSFDISKFKK